MPFFPPFSSPTASMFCFLSHFHSFHPLARSLTRVESSRAQSFHDANWAMPAVDERTANLAAEPSNRKGDNKKQKNGNKTMFNSNMFI